MTKEAGKVGGDREPSKKLIPFCRGERIRIMRIIVQTGLCFLTALLLLSACSDADKPPTPSVEGSVEILWDMGTGLSADHHLMPYLKERYPDVSFHATSVWRRGMEETVAPGMANTSYYDVVEQGVAGDLVMFESTLAPYMFKTGYLEPLDDFLATNPDLLDRLEPDAVRFVQAQGGGRTYAIPFGKNVYALFYNKTIFDELNMPYPTDGMTWDGVFDLARRMADHPRLAGRAALRIPDGHLVFSQLHIRVFDPETGEPDADSPVWERRRAFYADYRDLLEREGDARIEGDYAGFGAGKVAMLAGRWIGESAERGNEYTRGFSAPADEWDMASFPVHADAPDTGPAPYYYYVGIAKHSNRKKEAFDMISHLVSYGPQLENSRKGVGSVLAESEMKTRFGELSPVLEGKHVQAFFYHEKAGTMDPAFDLEMQRWSIYNLENGKLNEIMDYWRQRLAKIGAETE